MSTTVRLTASLVDRQTVRFDPVRDLWPATPWLNLSRTLIVCATLLNGNTVALAVQNNESAFMQMRAEQSYNAVIGLPAVAARPVESWELQLSLEHSNQFIGSVSGDEQLLLDGESSELILRYRQRWANCWQGELELPFISHSGGEFDRAIDEWHQFFGMPDGDRDVYPDNQLTYAYTRGDVVAAGVDAAQSGLGDIGFSVQRTLRCQAGAVSSASDTIVRAGIKLPTGNVNELRGSGRSDLFVDVQSPTWQWGEYFRGGATIGLMQIGQSDRLPEQRSAAAFGSIGSQWLVGQRFRIMTQLDWHTPFFRSALSELNDMTFKLSVGIRYLTRSNQSVELAISEDIAVGTAPDIVARLAWVYRPKFKPSVVDRGP